MLEGAALDPAPGGWRSAARKASFIAFTAALALSAIVFAWARLAAAAGKPMWLDEYYALATSVRGASLSRTLLLGAAGQGSPSPLDYLLLQALDGVRHSTGFLGLPPLSYYRLVSTLAIVASGVVVAVRAARPLSPSAPWATPARTIGALCCVVAYWYQPFALEYATQMRPYALWLSLSFLAYAVGPTSSGWGLAVAWSAVAATSTAALYQVTTLGAASLLVAVLDRRPWREAARRWLVPLTVPLLVSGYYALHAGKWHYWGPEWGTWEMFAHFWGGRWSVAVLSAAGVALCLVRRETRRFAVPCLAMLLLYAVAPAIYFLTRRRGFFFTDRQYVYYDLAGPLLMLTALRCLGAWTEGRRRSVPVLAVALCAGCIWLTAGLVRGAPGAAWSAWRTGRWPTYPADPEELLAPSRRGGPLPAGFCQEGEKPSERTTRNLELVADWLPVRHPGPIGAELVFVRPDGDGARVLAVREGRCPAAGLVEVHGTAR